MRHGPAGLWATLMLAAIGAQAQPTAGTSANVIVTGGADEMFASDVALEFALVYPGTQFASVGVGSRPVQEGFLQNDCTFGVLPDCSWSPLGASSPVDLAVTLVPLNAAQIAAYNQANGVADGPPIQYPLYGTALAIPVVNSAIKTNGSLVLGDGELCGILSGQITDWSQFSLKAAPGPFAIVYDADASSGATYLLTQHLNAVCDATNSAFTQLPVPITTNFASLPVPGGVAGNASFVAATGNAGMAAALLASKSAIGYLGPNFTSIYQHSPLTTALIVAALYNSADGNIYTPGYNNAVLALTNPGANAQNAAPPDTQAAAADPTRWVPRVPTPAKGYTIVGYANWIISTCYLSISPTVLQYLTTPYHAQGHAGVALSQGFVSLAIASPAYATAVSNVFLSNQAGYDLQIQNPVACSGRVLH